jgi:hypothetical protein
MTKILTYGCPIFIGLVCILAWVSCIYFLWKFFARPKDRNSGDEEQVIWAFLIAVCCPGGLLLGLLDHFGLIE